MLVLAFAMDLFFGKSKLNHALAPVHVADRQESGISQ
jgi:hypothetical protein